MADTFPAGHFYSPIPDIAELDPTRFADCFTDILTIREESVLPFARDVYAHGHELSDLMNSGQTLFQWSNPQFPPADALAYYGMLRTLRPNQVVEVGAGFSTQVAAEAVRYNGRGRITCVEPYPQDFLRDMREITLIERRLQDSPDEVFRSLDRGDVLFIDSSHQAKCQSDVLDVFFRVLDLLRVGVFIHFHDVFVPDDYPYFWLRDRGIFFNEQYLLLAFLKDNKKYMCRLPNAFLVRRHRKAYEQWVAGIHQPANESFVNLEHDFIKAGSFWIEKVA